MNLVAKRLIESGCRMRGDVRQRLEFWANRYGFVRGADEDDAFVFTRGSEWHALYTFDIRKVPTQVKIALVPDGDGLCLCTMTCASWLQMTTPGDESRFSEQMDLLEACLKAALAAQSRVGEPSLADPPPKLAVSSQHIKPA